jgi:phosphoribosylanthranilate isomerase
MWQPKIKICGITKKDQALEIAHLGIDALGFIFYPKSPRYIDPDDARKIIQVLPPFVKTIGVFVDEPFDQIIKSVRQSSIDLVQLHGSETPEYCHHLSKARVPWIKAFRVKDSFDPEILKKYPGKHFLLDAWSDDAYGGTGKTIDWEKIKPLFQENNLILAGGLNPENVVTAVNTTHPHGIDVSSGVENKPGDKSMTKIKALLQNLQK